MHVEVFVADSSEINTWHYLVKESFWRRDLNPDWLFVTFFENVLSDQGSPELGRLALFFTRCEDWPELFDLDLPTMPKRAEFVISSVWATYAARDRIRNRVLAAFVPNFKEFAEVLHDSQGPRHKKPAIQPTFKALSRFLTAAKEHGNRVCFVAFPVVDKAGKVSYDLWPEELQLIREAGMEFIDMRQVPELRPEHYRDEIHLTPAGAAIYSRRFAQIAGRYTERKWRSGFIGTCHDTQTRFPATGWHRLPAGAGFIKLAMMHRQGLPHYRRRVAHITTGLDTGGLEKLLLEFARQADRRRFDLAFVSLTTRGRLADDIEALGWPVFALEEPEGFRPSIAWHLAGKLRCWGADIVQTHDSRNPLFMGHPRHEWRAQPLDPHAPLRPPAIP